MIHIFLIFFIGCAVFCNGSKILQVKCLENAVLWKYIIHSSSRSCNEMCMNAGIIDETIHCQTMTFQNAVLSSCQVLEGGCFAVYTSRNPNPDPNQPYP